MLLIIHSEKFIKIKYLTRIFLNMTESYTEINGINICYEIFGDGYPVFLIHGFAANKEFWIAQVGELSKKFKVITMDNRGSGKSNRPNELYTMEMLAEDLKGLMDYLKIETAHLIGHSLGGAVIQHFILKYPERVNRLVLIASFTDLPLDQSGIEMYKNNQIAIYEASLKDPVKAFYDKMKIRFSRNFFKLMKENPAKKWYDLWSMEDLMKITQLNPLTSQDIINLSNALITHNKSTRLHKIKNETLILGAEKDRVVSKVSSEQLHQGIPNSKIKIFNEAEGHFLNLEKAAEVNQLIVDFLEN
jgi:pimeloyl-ACP methyl ester carboxylesterase